MPNINYFEFWRKDVPRKLETTTGTQFAPVYNNIFLDELEMLFIESFIEMLFIESINVIYWSNLWWRFLDEVFIS